MNSNFKADLFVMGLLLVAAVVTWFATHENNVIDIQFHDSYFVVDKSFLIGLLLGPLVFLIFMIRAIRHRFGTVSTNICLAIELVVMALITCYIIQAQQDYAWELQTFEDMDISTRQQMMDYAHGGILWSWVVFGVWGIALLLLIVRTVRLWRTEHARV